MRVILRESDLGDAKWLRKMLASGPLTDKLGAMASLVQNDPVHNVDMIEQLLAMGNKKGKREAQLAIQSLRELFTLFLLPDRPLRYISQQPLEVEGVNDKLLVLFYFEHVLKQKYAEVGAGACCEVVHRAAEEVQLRQPGVLQEDRGHVDRDAAGEQAGAGAGAAVDAGGEDRRPRQHGSLAFPLRRRSARTRCICC